MTPLETLYKKIYWHILIAGLSTIPVFLFPKGAVGAIGTIATFSFIAIALGYAITLLRMLPGHVPVIAFSAGLLLIASGAIADISATYLCSPDFNREANPIINMLLSFHVPAKTIHLLSVFWKGLVGALTAILWACFLKIYPKLIQTIPYANLLTTCKGVIGRGKVGFKDWILGRQTDFCAEVSFITLMCLASSFYDWYVALEWWELVPISRVIAPSGILLALLAMLVLITHHKLKSLVKKTA